MRKLSEKEKAAMDEAVAMTEAASDKYNAAVTREELDDAFLEMAFWRGVQDDVVCGRWAS